MWTILRLLALGLWVGAMIGFAFIFAPIAFANVGPTPAFAATVAHTLERLTQLGGVLGAFAVAVTVFGRPEPRRTSAAIVACIAVMISLGFVETAAVIPHMQATPLQTPAYDALHKQSSTIYSIVLLCGIAAFVLSALPARARS